MKRNRAECRNFFPYTLYLPPAFPRRVIERGRAIFIESDLLLVLLRPIGLDNIAMRLGKLSGEESSEARDFILG